MAAALIDIDENSDFSEEEISNLLIFDQDLEIVLEKDDLAELFEAEFILPEIPSINVDEGCQPEDNVTKPKKDDTTTTKVLRCQKCMKTYQSQIYYSKHITVCKGGKRNLSLAEKKGKFVF